jgi:hypothetical protein
VGCVCALLVTIPSLHFHYCVSQGRGGTSVNTTTQAAGILGSLAAAHKRAHRPLDPPPQATRIPNDAHSFEWPHEPLRHLPPPSTPINTLTLIFFSAAPPPIGIEFFYLFAYSESTFFYTRSRSAVHRPNPQHRRFSFSFSPFLYYHV